MHCVTSAKRAVRMKLKLLHRTALYAGALSLLVCLLVGTLALLAFEWQEQSLLKSALQAGVEEMHAHIAVGGWPDLNNSADVVSAVAPLNDLRAVPAELRDLPLGQSELEAGVYAEFEVLVRQIDNYRYYYGVSIAPSERNEASFAWIALFLVFSAVTISALMGWLFAWQLVRPMRAVALAIAQIDQNRTGEAVARQNQDEIDQIVGAINSYQTRLTDAAARETTFLSDVAHALRTPVAVIQSGLEILQLDAHQRDPIVLERVRRNSQQLVLKLDALMLSARKADLDGLERLNLAVEVELAMRFISARGSTSFVIDIATDVVINARSAVLRWVIIQCANSLNAHQVVEISWHAGALVFAGQDAVFDDLVLPELLAVVCAREHFPLSVSGAAIRLVLFGG